MNFVYERYTHNLIILNLSESIYIKVVSRETKIIVSKLAIVFTLKSDR